MASGFKKIEASELIMDKPFQDSIESSIESSNTRTFEHILEMHFMKSDTINIFSNCFLSKSNANYEPPTKAQVQSVVDLIISRGYSKREISRELGITTDNNRTLNYWVTESRNTNIPHSAWVHLTILAGLSLPTYLKKKD